MIIVKHKEFTKALSDGGVQLARFHALAAGGFACVFGTDYANATTMPTRELAEAWLASALVPHVMSGA